MPSFLCSAILFDLDGVLVDSTIAVEREWRAWGASKGIDGDAILAISHGMRTVEVIRRVAPQLDAEAEAREIEAIEAEDRDGAAAMPGAIELLARIPAARWCVVTSGSRHLATNRMRFCGLPVPRVMVTADDVTNGKPHPEPYLKGAQGLGFPASDCLVIEDAPAGIQAAHAAGARPIGHTGTFAAPQLHQADAVITKLSQVQIRVDADGRLNVTVQDA